MTTSAQKSRTDREANSIRKVTFFAFVLNLVLAGGKGLLALMSGSLAVTAGAIDSATDSVTSLAVFIGVCLAEKKTKNYPLGLYKIENLISVVVALFIFYAGYEIAVRALSPGGPAPRITLSILVFMFLSTLAIYGFGRFALHVGRRTGSPTLLAEAKHRQVDVLSSLVVLTSVTLGYFNMDFDILGIGIDRLGAAIVLLFIAKAGWELLSEGVRALLDASIDSRTLEEIRDIINEHPLVTKTESLIASNAGRFVFIQAEIRLRTADLEKAHQASEEIEKNIRRALPRADRITIHYEPCAEKCFRLAMPLNAGKEALSDNFGAAPYFAFLDFCAQDRNSFTRDIQANPYQSAGQGRGIKVAAWLANLDIDRLVVKDDIRDKGPGIILDDAGVEIRVADLNTVREALEVFGPYYSEN